MLKQLFGLKSKVNRHIVDSLYASIVAASRQSAFYSQADVPDTPLGRFEMLSLHMFLFLHRLRGTEGAARDLSQEVTDLFITEIDHSLRELGIGDMGIPRHVKKLARMFYGRAQAYGEALDAAEANTLAEALRRNIQPDRAGWPGATQLAEYVMDAHHHLAQQPVELILKGRLEFPEVKGMQP